MLLVHFTYLVLAAMTEAKSATYTANFEVPNSGEGPVFLPLNGTVPGGYDALYWTNFRLPSYSELYGSPGCFELCASSFYELAYSTAYPATISAQYHKSRVRSFDLREFYGGCYASANVTTPSGRIDGLTEPPNCTITAKAGGHIARFTYRPQIMTNKVGTNYSTLQNFKLPAEFKNLKEVQFSAAFKGAPPQGIVYNEKEPVLALDDVVYTVHNGTK